MPSSQSETEQITKVLARLDSLKEQTWLSAAQQRVLATMRQQAQEYHAKQDRLLDGFLEWLEAHVARWRQEWNERQRV